MSSLLRDLRYALRGLLRNRGFTALAATTLALAIGSTAVVFSVAHAVLVQPLPFANAAQTMVIHRLMDDVEEPSPFSFPAAEDVLERHRAFDDIGLFHIWAANLLAPDGDPERLDGLLISADMPEILGVTPAVGRFYTPDEDRPGGPRTVVLSHELWTRRYGANPDLAALSVQLDGLTYSVIGVFPADLRHRRVGSARVGDFWLPLGIFRDRLPNRREETTNLFLLGRLSQGKTLADGQRDVDRIGRELAVEYPLLNRSQLVAVGLVDMTVGEVRPALHLLLLAVALVLLVACTNLASLFLTRALRRGPELATRMALGAGRWRLLRQLLTEAVVLGILGGAVGLVLGVLGLAALRSVVPPEAITGLRLQGVTIGPPVLAVTAILTLVAALIAGLLPALQASRPSLLTGSARSGGSKLQHHVRRFLVGGEVAVALVLAIGALLMLSSLRQLQHQDPGYDPDQVLSAEIILPTPKYAATAARVAYFDQVLQGVAGLPGVRNVAVTSNLPVGGSGSQSIVYAGDGPIPRINEWPITYYQLVSDRFFETLDIPVIAGRGLSADDDDRREAPHVVVISRGLARTFWPGAEQEAVGNRLAFELEGTRAEPIPVWREIVGVVDNVRYDGLTSTAFNAVYVPYTQSGLWFRGGWGKTGLVIKTNSDPLAVAGSVRGTVLEVDPGQPIQQMSRLVDALDAELSLPRLVFWLLGAFAGLAIVLALVGVYGISAQAVAAGARELGTRAALGATPRQLMAGVLRQSFWLVFAGLIVGWGLAVMMSRTISSLLFGVGSLDPKIYFLAGLGLALVALVATAIPAWQASRIDPSRALRIE